MPTDEVKKQAPSFGWWRNPITSSISAASLLG